MVNDFIGTPQGSEWTQHGAQALDFLGMDVDELAESKSDILEEMQEARAYRK